MKMQLKYCSLNDTSTQGFQTCPTPFPEWSSRNNIIVIKLQLAAKTSNMLDEVQLKLHPKSLSHLLFYTNL